MNSKRAAAVSLTVVLFLGILIGIVIDRLIINDLFHPPFERRHRPDFFADLTRELQLNAQQQDQLKTLLEEVKSKHEALRKSMGPQFHGVRQEFQEKFKQILTEEQKITFEKFNKKDPPREPPRDGKEPGERPGERAKQTMIK